jgi:hypothetical protein
VTRDILSKGGTDQSWMRSSARGFDAVGKLACSYFGPRIRVRDVTLADCRDYVEKLGSVPHCLALTEGCVAAGDGQATRVEGRSRAAGQCGGGSTDPSRMIANPVA